MDSIPRGSFGDQDAYEYFLEVSTAGTLNRIDPTVGGRYQLIFSTLAVPGSVFDLDGDGAVDSADATLICSTGTDVEANGGLLGDLDLSGDVSFADFLTLSANFGNEGNYAQGDVDCSGGIGFADFLVLSQNFGQSQSAIPTPEPGANTTLLLGLVGVMFAVRQRQPKA